MAAALDPGRFDSTVPHYVAHRLRYPPELLRLTLAQLGLTPGVRVLDLGCGPGFLANGYALMGCPAVGIDPSEAMLVAARAEAAAMSVAVDYRLGSSLDLDGLDERFDLVVMGRSFHWMERAATLRALDRIVAPGGAVVLCYDRHIRSAENAPVTAADRVREKFGRTDKGERQRPAGALVPDETIFLDSAFPRLLRLGLVARLPVTVEALVGRSFSTSFTSPEALGERRPEFEAELRKRFAALNPDGQLTELVEFTAMIATRREWSGDAKDHLPDENPQTP